MNAPFAKDPALMAGAMAQQPFAWIGDLVGFLRRNWKLQSICVGVAVLLALLYVLTATPRFTASATLLIDTRQTDLFQQHPLVSDAQIENAIIESDVEVLRSPGLMRRLAERLDLAHDPAFMPRSSLLSRITGAPPTSSAVPDDEATAASAQQDRLIQRLLTMINPHRVGLTYVIEVDATATTPALSARLANGLIEAYVQGQVADRTSANRQASGWLEGRLVAARDKALAADQAVQAFKAKSGIVDTGHGTLEDQQFTELQSQLVSAQGRTTDAQARLDRIRQALLRPGGAVSDSLTSPVINGLRERYLNDAQRVAEWSARFGSDHLAAATLRKEMTALQSSIDSEMRRIEKAAESDLEVARASQAALKTQLDALVGRSASFNMERATLRSLQSAADSYRTLYGAFLQRAAQSVQNESFPVADARIVTVAYPPLTKSKPQGKLILLLAIILGLGAGFVISLLREVLDHSLRTTADVEGETGLVCLATLPSLSQPPLSPGAGEADVAYAVSNPDTPFGHGILRLQLRVQPLAATGRGGVVGVVALAHGAGTSTVSANLAASLAASGFSVSVFDLSGHQRLAATEIRNQIETRRRDHDVVIIDFPPLSDPAQAHAVAADVNQLVLVIKAGQTTGADVTDTLRAAGLDQRALFGVVVNRCDQAA